MVLAQVISSGSWDQAPCWALCSAQSLLEIPSPSSSVPAPTRVLPLSLSQIINKFLKKRALIQKDTCTPMFIAALFTVAKLWRQPKGPLIDEWIKMWYIYTMKYYSAVKKNEVLPFATTWLDLEGIMLSEVSQRKTNTI